MPQVPFLPAQVVYFLCGAFSDTVASIIYVPLEVAKTRMQLQGNTAAEVQLRYRNVAHALRTIARTEGARGLYTGYRVTLARDVPFSALQFTVYDSLRYLILRHRQPAAHMSRPEELACGAAAGAVAGALTTPLDVIKTRLQTQAMYRPTGTYAGFWGETAELVRTHGWTVLSRGLAARVVWTMPLSAATFFTYEQLLRVFDRLRGAPASGGASEAAATVGQGAAQSAGRGTVA